MNLYGAKQLVESMRTVRKNTVQIAEDIPEQNYAYRPTPESRSVAETLLHILAVGQASERIHSQRMTSLANVDFVALLAELPVQEKQRYFKTEIVSLLASEGERWTRWLEQLPESVLAETVTMPGPAGEKKTRFELLLGYKEHEMHHRAQLTVIERLMGIVPHLTRNRQARGAAAPAAAGGRTENHREGRK